mgnify:CR=1 FL=1
MDTTPPTKPRGRLRDAMQALLVPAALTDDDTLNRVPSPGLAELANRDQYPGVMAGDLAQRVTPERGALDAFPDEHPHAAIPFATDELRSNRFGTPPIAFVAEQATAQPAAWTRRFPLAQFLPFLVVPADTRPRRVLVRVIGAGNVYLHMIQPQRPAGAADTDGMLMLSTDAPIVLTMAGEVWAVSDTTTSLVNVLVDYSAVDQVRLAGQVAATLAAAMPAPCSCNASP